MEGIRSQPQETEREDAEDDQVCKINLRPLDPSDIDDFMVWATDDKVSKYCTWETCTSKKEAMDHLLNKAITHPWLRGICLDNKPIGYILVTPESDNIVRKAEIGYVLAFKYWGKGFATRAVKLVVSSILEEWPHLERLEALVDDENKGSQRVLEKVGFQKGVLRKYLTFKGKCRDMAIYSLLTADLPLNYILS